MVLLTLLAVLAWGYVQMPVAAPRAEAQARVDAATQAVAQTLRDAVARLDADARRWREATPVRAALAPTAPPEADAALLRWLADASSGPARASVDVWRDTALVAWSGPRIPLAPPGEGAASEGTALVRTPDGRDVLVVTLALPGGHVRTATTLRFSPYVQNRYLQPFDRVAEAAAPFGVRAALRPSTASDAARTSIPDEGGSTGTGVGVTGLGGWRLDAAPPTTAAVTRAVRTRRADVAAFWTVLALLMAAAAVHVALPARRGARLVGQITLLVALRAALLLLDVPGRWLDDGALAPLFDPVRYAVGGFGGALRSVGDLVLTTAAVLAAALLAAHALRKTPRPSPTPARVLVRAFGLGAVTAVLAAGMSRVAQRSVIDSTLDLFTRSGLLPEPLVAVVFAALLALALAVVLLGARTAEAVQAAPAPARAALAAAAGFAAGAVPFSLPLLALPLVVCALSLGVLGLVHRLAWSRLTVRLALALLLVLTAGLYPLLYRGFRAQRLAQMEDAVRAFDEASGDPRLVFALDETLGHAARDDSARVLLALPDTPDRRTRLDRRAAEIARDGLLASLGTYDVGVVFFDAEGRISGRYADGALPGADADTFDLDEFDLLRSMAASDPSRPDTAHTSDGPGAPNAEATDGMAMPSPLIVPLTGRQQDARFQTLGIVPIPGGLGWATARAAPQRAATGFGTPFPRVLLPAGTDDGPGDFALALFRDGVLVRGQGRDFGHYRLDAEAAQVLATRPRLLRAEADKATQALTLYVRQQPSGSAGFTDAPYVVAVRVPAFSVFDHLFFALRVLLSGVLLAALVYAAGLVVRQRRGLLPYRRVRFQDRVLDAFLAVGGVSVVAVALLGVRVVTGENTRAVDDWLARSLERTEDALVLAAAPGETVADVLARLPLDSLARRVGVDLSVYEGRALVRTTRPTLVREGLLDPRLPVDAAARLEADGDRVATADAFLGTFRYRVGYRVLPDAAGRPRAVLAVPTLPEQERFEQEQARMLAYLFGALVLLLVALAATAALLARALAQPVRQLRAGLEAVGRGRFDQPLAVRSRDEIGDLGRTFNAMQAQLSDSRARLAQQERQLAWGEMARQVAHEIKNPLTPMKLSVQHLRRARADAPPDADRAQADRFDRLFDRVTTTLLEQIDALTRIASDFSTFGRLPRRRLEHFDLRAVAEEAADLMRNEDADANVALLLPEAPLWVEADHEELRRVFINLVKNAVQAMDDRDERRVTVALSAEPGHAETGGAETGQAVARVSDTGTGIPAALVPRIFEPNFSTKTRGTGLGLAIARKAVEDSGGTIAFETEEGVGTTFTVRLPLALPG